jgi:hypothetical protein
MSPLAPAGPAVAMSAEDRRWAEKSGELELESLSSIRGLAEKWAASLTGVLGVVGLAALFESAGKFDSLDSPWKAIAQVCFTVAIVLGLIAAALAILAAQGAAKRVFVPGGTALRLYSQAAVDSALGLLKASRWIAAVAALLVLAAGYCLWFGDHKQGSPTVIELPRGGQLCPPGTTAAVGKSDADFVVRCRP